MKNNSKRILALLLAIVMCVSCVVPVFAETTHNHDEHSTSATVDKTQCQHKIDEEGTHIYVEDADGNPAAHLTFIREKEPTCTEGGFKLYQCNECGTPVLNTSEAITEAKEHDWNDEAATLTEATCGSTVYKLTPCKRCSAVKEEVVEKVKEEEASFVINMTHL